MKVNFYFKNMNLSTIFLKKHLFYRVYCLECMSVTTCPWCLWMGEDCIRSPKIANTNGCELPRGCWEGYLSPLEEQPWLLPLISSLLKELNLKNFILDI